MCQSYGGGGARNSPRHAQGCVRRSRQAGDGVQHLFAATLSAAQVAELTHKSRSQVTRDLILHKLYGLRAGSHWRVPRWQFAGGAALPGLPIVVPVIPDHLHPTVVEGFMITPQDALDGRTPVDHLYSGGRPDLVADLVAELARQ